MRLIGLLLEERLRGNVRIRILSLLLWRANGRTCVLGLVWCGPDVRIWVLSLVLLSG